MWICRHNNLAMIDKQENKIMVRFKHMMLPLFRLLSFLNSSMWYVQIKIT